MLNYLHPVPGAQRGILPIRITCLPGLSQAGPDTHTTIQAAVMRQSIKRTNKDTAVMPGYQGTLCPCRSVELLCTVQVKNRLMTNWASLMVARLAANWRHDVNRAANMPGKALSTIVP